MFRHKIEEVWTPRQENVNHSMFIIREQYEDLVREIRGDYNLVIHGHSGCGKSWLYQKAFDDLSVNYVSINCSDVNHTGNLDNCFRKTILMYKDSAIKRKQSISFSLGLPNIASVKYVRELEKTERDISFYEFVAFFSKYFGGKRFFIVFENFEHVIHLPMVLDGVGVAIMSKGDINFRRFDFRVMIVGISTEFARIASHFRHSDSVRTRLREIHEVLSLTRAEAFELMDRGFSKMLKLAFDDREAVYDKIYYYSSGTPLMIHDLCRSISHYCVDTGKRIDEPGLLRALFNLYRTSEFIHEDALREKLEDKGHVEFKTRVLNEIAEMDESVFTSDRVEEVVRENHPQNKYYQGVVSDFLVSLCREPHPIMRFDSKLGLFYLSNPIFRTVLKYVIRETAPTKFEIMSDIFLRSEAGFETNTRN